MAFMRIPVYNLESYEYFKMGVCTCLCHSFNFVNMRFVVKVIFFGTYFSLLNSTRRFTFMESLLQNIVISFFLLSHMFPWMNKFRFT